MKTTLGQRIRKAREAMGISQTELAARLGLSAPDVLCHWEMDRCGPKRLHLFALCELFGMTADELLGFEQLRKSTKKRLTRAKQSA